jgi:DNA-binding response OmpR family regulator
MFNFQSHSQLPLERATAFRQRWVLVLESDRLIKSLIMEWLQMSGWATLCAHETARVDEIACRCDLVLADVPAPLKAAREFVAGLMRAMPGTPVIAMSADIPAHGRSASVALARELGAAAVLVKPFNREALLHAIKQAAA